MNRDTLYFILVFAFIIFISDNGKLPVTDLSLRALAGCKDILKNARRSLQHSQYGEGYGNLTGFKLSYDDNLLEKDPGLWPLHEYTHINPWTETQTDSILPNVVSDKVKQFWSQESVMPGNPAYLLNISGDVYGEFEITQTTTLLKPFHNQIPSFLEDYYESLRNQKYQVEKQRYENDPENNLPPQELSDTIDKVGNITKYSEGDMILRVGSLESAISEANVQNHNLGVYKDAVLVSLQVELRNYPKSDTNEFEMLAIYFQDTGSIVGLTKSAKFLGLHALPHFTLNSNNFERSQTLIGRFINMTNIENDVTTDDISRSAVNAQTRCELVTFIQLEKTSYDSSQLRFIDDELANPHGLPLPKNIPQIEVKHALAYSPDCGLLFERKANKPFVGIRQEVKYFQLKKVLFFVFLLTLLELRLFMRQTKFCRTPSSLSNVSTISIGLLSGYDLLIAMLMTLIMWLTDLYLLCACLAVFNILLFYVFQLRYLLTISATQANERGSTWTDLLRGSTIRQNQERDLEAQSDNAATTPPITTGEAAVTPTQESIISQGTRSPIQFFMVSFFISFGVTLLALKSFSWGLKALRIFEFVALIGFNSFLLPQFLRNTIKNKSRTLLWEFSIGTSLVRLIPLYYLCLDKSNTFRHPYDPTLVIVVTGWLLAQLVLLYLQSKFGASFWINSKWLPEQYDYQPTLTLQDLKSEFSSEILLNFKPEVCEGDFLLCEIDCAICMSGLTLPILMSDSPKHKVSNPLMKKVIVTPCHHIFHLDCLEGWMNQKLQCPVCRTALPPI